MSDAHRNNIFQDVKTAAGDLVRMVMCRVIMGRLISSNSSKKTAGGRANPEGFVELRMVQETCVCGDAVTESNATVGIYVIGH